MLLISIGLRLAAPSAGASNLLFLLPCQVLASLFFLVWARPLLLLSIAPSETFAVAAAWHAYNAMCRPNVSHLLTHVEVVSLLVRGLLVENLVTLLVENLVFFSSGTVASLRRQE